MKEAEIKKDKTYLFGFEESYGCLIGDYARDKDGIAAVMSLCEAASYYKSRGKTLWDAMQDIYKKYGYYEETQVSNTLEGADGAKRIREIMDKMRNTTVEQINNLKVITFKDIENDIQKNIETGEITKTGLPKSNVLYYELEDDNWCCIRPSGTEPKIKVYMGAKGVTKEEAKERLEGLKEEMIKIIK